MVISSIRRNLLATTIIAGSLIAMPVYAQTPVPATTADTPADTAAAAEGDTIVVTGSLLTNPNLQQSTPVNVTTSAEIQLRQSNVAEEVLRNIPGIVPSIGSAVNNGNGGASFVDLRGLGSNRNIVLLDGFRIAPAGLSGQVDLNNIPLALVERVDALTGGASTTYGADAVSGVVNFITRKDFAGAEISAGTQINEAGDGNYNRLDVTLGANFDDGRGNAVFSVGYQQSDPVYQGDRDYSVDNIDSFSGTLGGSGTGVPSRISGTRPIDPATGLPSVQFCDAACYAAAPTNAAGDKVLPPLTQNGGVRQIDPTTGRAVGTFALFNFNPYNIFQTPFTRYNMYGAAHYQVSDAVEVYTRGLFSKNIIKTIVAPSGVFAASVGVPLSNPYLPAATRAQYCAFNVAPVDADTGTQLSYQARLSVAQCSAAAGATSPTDPNYQLANFTLNRRLVEGGPRVSKYQTTLFDYRIGARGGITDAINWDVSGGYGESENTQALQGYVLTSRARQALLATSTTTCLDSSNGCVPLNIFGPSGSISSDQAAFLQAESTSTITTSLAQARAIVNGDLGVASPFASDGINFAIGGEYRKYRATQRSDLLAKTAGELGGAGGAAPDIDGAYDVYEALAEVNVPLVQDKPFFDSLSVEAGVRYSHYTIDAPTTPKFNTTTYKFGGSWSPVKDIKIRGGFAHSVRAPNISELFTPVSTGLTNLATDPCAGGAPLANATLRAICVAQGAPSATIGSILNPTAGQANTTTGGNLNLKPEKSNSYTIGAVVTPAALSGLSLTVDYYNITVTNAITSATPGDIVALCFANATAASAASPACQAFGRNPTTGGLDGDPATTLGLIAPLSNSGRLKTDGIDVSASYRRDLGFAKLALSFTGNYTFRSKFQATSVSLNRDCTGYYSVNCASIQPKFQWNQRTTLTFGAVDVSVQWRHIDKVKQEPQDVIDTGPAFVGSVPGYGNVDFGRIKAANYFDFTTRFGMTDDIDLTIGVQNLTNRKPPLVGSTIGSTSYNSGNTYPSTYDALGRRYAVGVKVKM